MEENVTTRYSDLELEEFRILIQNKLDKAQSELAYLMEQIVEITENNEDDFGGDWIDDSSISTDVEMLNNMAIRQRQFVRELENSLVRVRNKTYGICIVTGKLIDKKRLQLVPHATKSMEAKNIEGEKKSSKPASSAAAANEDEEDDKSAIKLPKAPAGPKKIITKVIRKPTPGAVKPKIDDDDDDDLDLGPEFDDDEDIVKLKSVKGVGIEDDIEISTDDDDFDADDYSEDAGFDEGDEGDDED